MIEIFQHTVSSIMAIRLTVRWGGCTKPEKELHTEHYTVNVADTAQRKGEFFQPKMLQSEIFYGKNI